MFQISHSTIMFDFVQYEDRATSSIATGLLSTNVLKKKIRLFANSTT